jgi:hypothetical protein
VIASLIAIVLGSPTLPKACEPPPARDVTPLAELAKKSGALSVGLDSIATWCFDSGGAWTGGHTLKKGQQPDPAATPSGDCAKAIGVCEGAKTVLTADLRALLYDVLADMETPFLGLKYTPKRSGLAERPPEIADCRSKNRSELFAQAQARMDIARLANQAQSEYRNFRTWLYKQSLTCAQLVARGETDLTRRGIAVDTPVAKSESTMQVDAGQVAPSLPGVGAVKDAPQETVVVTRDGPASAVVVTKHSEGAPFDTRSSSTGGTAPSGAVGTSGAEGMGTRLGDAAVVAGAATAGPGTSGGPAVTSMPSVVGPGAGAVGAVESGTMGVGPIGAETTGMGGAGMERAAIVGARTAGAGVAGAETSRMETAGGGSDAPAMRDIPLGGPTVERQRALASSMVVKWRYLAEQRSRIESDPDWAMGFLVSRELRDCKCQRVEPKDIVSRLEAGERVAALQADDEKNTRCELCLQDSYPPWKIRVQKQCAQMDELTDYELGVLQRSDDGNGLPPRCFEASRIRRAARAPAKEQATAAAGPSRSQGGSAFIITKMPDPPTAPLVQGGGAEKPTDYAPIPPREEGHVYYRVFMSRACEAEVEPGPITARTGDLMPVPPDASSLVVKSACGGLVEVYFGREEKPRVTEVFGKNQPLRLKFRKP